MRAICSSLFSLDWRTVGVGEGVRDLGSVVLFMSRISQTVDAQCESQNRILIRPALFSIQSAFRADFHKKVLVKDKVMIDLLMRWETRAQSAGCVSFQNGNAYLCPKHARIKIQRLWLDSTWPEVLEFPGPTGAAGGGDAENHSPLGSAELPDS